MIYGVYLGPSQAPRPHKEVSTTFGYLLAAAWKLLKEAALNIIQEKKTDVQEQSFAVSVFILNPTPFGESNHV